MVCCCFVKSPAWDFECLSHSLNPLSGSARGSLLCMPSLFPCPVCPLWKSSHSCQQDISKITQEELCQAGTSVHVCESGWLSLATHMSSHHIPCWETSPGCRKVPSHAPLPPSTWAAWEGHGFGGFPMLRASQGRWGWWGCISATSVRVWAGTGWAVSSQLSTSLALQGWRTRRWKSMRICLNRIWGK